VGVGMGDKETLRASLRKYYSHKRKKLDINSKYLNFFAVFIFFSMPGKVCMTALGSQLDFSILFLVQK
jgi:hypothetical protein